MASVKVTTVENTLGVILPRDLLAKLRVDIGDTLYVTETPNGIELSPLHPDSAAQVHAAKAIMRDNCDVLKKLAE